MLVLAERPGAAEELCAGARAMEGALVAFGDMEMPPSCADLIYRVTVPEGLSLDNATATVNAIFDHVRPDVVLVEPTRHMRILAGALAFHGGTSAIADVMELDGDAGQPGGLAPQHVLWRSRYPKAKARQDRHLSDAARCFRR